jgi:hypothetical protein
MKIMTRNNRFRQDSAEKQMVELAQIREKNEEKISTLSEIFTANFTENLFSYSQAYSVLDMDSVNQFAPNFELNTLIAEIIFELDPGKFSDLTEFAAAYKYFFKKFYGNADLSNQKVSLIKTVKPTPANLEEWLSNLRIMAIVLEKFHGEEGHNYLKQKFLSRYVKKLVYNQLSIDISTVKSMEDCAYINTLSGSYTVTVEKLSRTRQRILKTLPFLESSEEKVLIKSHLQELETEENKEFFTALNLKFPDPMQVLDLLLANSNTSVH